MAITTKHLIKLYSEYKKLGQPKGYYEGQEVKNPIPSPTPTPNPGPVLPGAKSFQDSFRKGYSEGGDVASPSGRRYRSDAGDYLSNDEYDQYKQKMADYKAKNAVPGINEYAKAQRSNNNGPDPVDVINQQIATDPTIGAGIMQAPAPSDLASGVKAAGMSKGGEVPHNKTNLEHLKSAFDKFLSEEGKQKYSKGGQVKGYADGTSDGEPVQDDENDAEIIRQRPDSDSAIDKLAQDEFSDKTPDQEDEIDRSKEPADLESVKKDEPSLEDKQAEEKKFEEDFKDKEREPASEEEPDKSEESKPEEPSEDEKKDIQDQGFTSKINGIQTNSDRLGSPEALAKAQAQRQNTINSTNMLQMGNLAASGIAGSGGAHVNPLPASYFQTLNNGANLPVQNINEQIANQKNDPNSQVSKVMNQYLSAKGFNLPPGTSAADAEKVMPFLSKDQAYQNAIQKVLLQQGGAQKRAELANTTKADIAEKNREAAMERTKESNKGKTAAATAGLEAKNTKTQNDAEIKAENDITNARSKPAIQQAYRNSIAIKNAQKMFEEFPDPDKWTPSQVALYNVEVAKVAGGQAPTEGMIHDLSNPTAASGMAGLMQKITNVPVGAQQGDFIRLNQKYMNGLADVSNGVIKDNMGNVIKASQDKLGSDKYKNMLYRHSDMLGLYTPQQEKGIAAVQKAKGLSRQDAIKGLIKQGAIKDLNY
jgi:hypothetical protein